MRGRIFLLPCFLLGVLLLTGCSQPPSSRRQEMVMGVFNEVVVLGKEKADRERLLDRAFQILHDVDEKMSHFKTTSEVSRTNQKGFEAPQKVSPDTFEVIQKSVEFFEVSGGVFDITVFPLMKLWGFYEGEPHLPRAEEIQSLLARVNVKQLTLNSKKREVSFQAAGMGIDLGGIAKGYACDRVVELLKKEGIDSALVNVGGTIAAFGNSPDGKPWRVGILHPRDPTRTLRVITLVNEAIATSGDYENFFVVNGHRYSHILNPQTGYPAHQTVAVSVIAPSALLADVLSTSLFVLGPEKAHFLMNQYPQVRWYLTYFADGDRFKTLSSEPTV